MDTVGHIMIFRFIRSAIFVAVVIVLLLMFGTSIYSGNQPPDLTISSDCPASQSRDTS